MNAERVRRGDVNRRILNAAAASSAGSILVKLIATVKEFVVAGVYGRSDAMDAFLSAALFPGLLINLISESMNQALIPALVRAREVEGEDSARQLLSNLMVLTLWLLLLGSLTAGLLASSVFPHIFPHYPHAKLKLTVRLFCCMLPVVAFVGVASNCAAALNTTGRFAVPALAPMATPIVIIVAAPLLSARLGIWALACATLLGAIFHGAWMLWLLNSSAYRLSLRWHGMNESTREVARQFVPVLLSSVVSSSGLLVDQSMAALLPSGSVSALVYGSRFVSVALALLAGVVSSAVAPYFSQMVALSDWEGCRHTLRTWGWLTVLISVPVTVALVAGAQPLIRLTIQHGGFGAADTAVVRPVLEMSALQIPFFVCSRVFYRFLVAMRRSDLILYCGLLNLGLDIVFNLVLMRWLGLAGIALSTSLWTMSTLMVLWFWSRKVLRSAKTSHRSEMTEEVVVGIAG